MPRQKVGGPTSNQSSKTPSILKYRLAILNLSVDAKLVRNMAKEDLGDTIKVLNYEIERIFDFQGLVLNGGRGGASQRITLVTLRYVFKKTE
jgi:hypothetical protein